MLPTYFCLTYFKHVIASKKDASITNNDIVVNCESKIQKGFSEGLSAQWQVQEQLKGLIKL